MKKGSVSLRQGLLTVIVICWLVPLILVTALAGLLLENSYQNSASQEIRTSVENAMQQVQMQLENAISDSKAVSYDGVIRSAYRSYLQNGDSAALYRGVNDYLTQNFSREKQYKAVFISFWDKKTDADAYLLSSGTTGAELLEQCRKNAVSVLETMQDADTDIRFLVLDGELYMARNLLDSSFLPYASVVMLPDCSILFRSLQGISRVRNVQVLLDRCALTVGEAGILPSEIFRRTEEAQLQFAVEADGHTVSFSADMIPYDLWAENPWGSYAIAGVVLMLIPLLAITISVFNRHVSRPMETLARANTLVQSGQRGYVIQQKSPNAEFSKLYDHFNAMSMEMQRQFEQSYLEQQAAQKAQIKALQSQINPHFLNNTLEIINWEARFAENERVCAMIEALSTMLDAALDRDGRTQIPLKEELGYVDAYLYIIRERLGEKFRVHKQIDEEILDHQIPRLILQPIVENAVEHDITARRGGNLWVRVYCEAQTLVLEVEHDGTMSDADRENIRRLLQDTSTDGMQVGLKNVSQRLRLIYGSAGKLAVEETTNGTILARVCIPMPDKLSIIGEETNQRQEKAR